MQNSKIFLIIIAIALLVIVLMYAVTIHSNNAQINSTVASNVLINSSVNSTKTITPVANLSPDFNYPIKLELLNKIFGGNWNAYNLLNMQHNLSYGINSIIIENVTNASGYKMAIAILNLSNVSLANSAYNLLSSSSESSGFNNFNAGAMPNGRPYFISPVRLSSSPTNYTSFGTVYKNKIISILLPISSPLQIEMIMPKVESLFENISNASAPNVSNINYLSANMLDNAVGYNWVSINSSTNIIPILNANYTGKSSIFVSNTLGYDILSERVLFPNTIISSSYYNNFTSLFTSQSVNTIYYAYILGNQLPYSIFTVANSSNIMSYSIDANSIFALNLINAKNSTAISPYNRYELITLLFNYMEGNYTLAQLKNDIAIQNITKSNISSNSIQANNSIAISNTTSTQNSIASNAIK
ncbi:MAG: hypothetical protein M1385_01525 [Candidatus Marsarchaeota archaeon]|nr:hypothetical protein [Candidatus Marsarchaeota archaeon]